MNKNGSLVAPEILVVDDEIDIRELMAGILADEGYETRVASDSDGTLADTLPWMRSIFGLLFTCSRM